MIDESDALLDRAIIPFLKELNQLGFTTLQSCSGHVGSETHPSALVWVFGDNLSDDACKVLSELPGVETVGRLWGRESFPIVEIVFGGETLPGFRARCTAIVEVMREHVPSCRPRTLVGEKGVRDPDHPCSEFDPGAPSGECETDGHYLCNECVHRFVRGTDD